MLLLWMQGDPDNNVGDIITPYLYSKITNLKPEHWTNYYDTNRDIIYGSGSILSNFTTRKNVIIWGSGVMTEKEELNNVKNILAVRGPITRKLFLKNNIECPEIYGDPALCLPLVYPKINSEKKFKLGIIPHFVDFEEIYELYKDVSDINIISVRLDVESFVDEVCKCEKTISTSLHGMIISHAYCIPSISIKVSDKLCGDGTKFVDYKLSVGLDNNKISNINLRDKDINFLLNLVENETQPQFPIEINKLWEICPFKS
jgi:pyruvyltransferase